MRAYPLSLLFYVHTHTVTVTHVLFFLLLRRYITTSITILLLLYYYYYNNYLFEDSSYDKQTKQTLTLRIRTYISKDVTVTRNTIKTKTKTKKYKKIKTKGLKLKQTQTKQEASICGDFGRKLFVG